MKPWQVFALHILGLGCRLVTIAAGVWLCRRGHDAGGVVAIILGCIAQIDAVSLLRKENDR